MGATPTGLKVVSPLTSSASVDGPGHATWIELHRCFIFYVLESDKKTLIFYISHELYDLIG
jgi:hypothetical protein